jgi:hypothetical protein
LDLSVVGVSFLFAMNLLSFASKKEKKQDAEVLPPHNHNILEPMLGWPFKKESKTTLIPRIW